MKKITIFLTVLCVICMFSFTALAAGNYPSTNADWGTQVQVNTDGTVTFSADWQKVVDSGVLSGVAWYYVAIYDADQNFTADSDMTGDGSVYATAQLTDGMTLSVGENTPAGNAYPFVEGNTYYAYFLASDGSGWGWNYAPVSFVYSVPEPDYPSTDADWGTQVQVNADGTVTFSADWELVVDSGVLSGVAWYYVAVYDADQNFTAYSNMTGDGSVFATAQLTVGMTLIVGENTPAGNEYPFVEGNTYYAYFLACDGATWGWNYAPVTFVYNVPAPTEAPTEEPTEAPTEAPTDAPTDAPTEAPAEEPSDTADISTIAFALAAITGCGALVIRKKK